MNLGFVATKLVQKTSLVSVTLDLGAQVRILRLMKTHMHHARGALEIRIHTCMHLQVCLHY